MNNAKIILSTILVSILFILVVTLYKVHQNHIDATMQVTHKRIIEGAIQCVWDDLCSDNVISFGTLIELGYAKEEVNPLTKMYYSHNSYVEKKDGTYTFIEVD